MVYDITGENSNSLKSRTPDSCFRERTVARTLKAAPSGNNTVPDIAYWLKKARRYFVRRFTPLECCRLQGFPDWWEDGVDGSDSARYMMWGNGMALPCVLYVMEGFIAEE